MPDKSIVVLGSANTDMIIRVPRLPAAGETVLGGELMNAAGGKGANQAVGAARAGGRVTFIARVGRDAFGDEAIASLAREGIDVRHVSRDPTAASGAALIFVAADGQNSIAVSGGANNRLTPAHVLHAASAISAAAIMMMQLETSLASVQKAASLAHRAGVPVLLNPAPARALPASLMQRIRILTPNETEAEILTGLKVNTVAAAAKACARLRERGVRTVILTLGSRGAFVADETGNRHVPGFEVKAVDTTAAGDIFNGALAVALAEDAGSKPRPLIDAVRFASAAAALSVTRHGAQPSAPTRSAIASFLRRHA